MNGRRSESSAITSSKPAHRRIHWADNVGNITLWVAGLILNVSCLVVFADPAVHRGMIRPGTGFISKGPQDDGRMVFITQYHTGCTLQISGCPLSGCTELSAVTVRLKICLIDKVNAKLVTQIIPFHGIRIMAGTNSVEIQAVSSQQFLFASAPQKRYVPSRRKNRGGQHLGSQGVCHSGSEHRGC